VGDSVSAVKNFPCDSQIAVPIRVKIQTALPVSAGTLSRHFHAAAKGGRPRNHGIRYESGRFHRSQDIRDLKRLALIARKRDADMLQAYPIERTQHDPVELAVPDAARDPSITDSLGNRGAPYRVVDVLLRLRRADEIDDAMLTAGQEFRRVFATAFHDGIKAVDIAEPTVSGRKRAAVVPHIEDAREIIAAKLRFLGGSHTLAGSCAWHVIGEAMPLEDWTRLLRWSGRDCSDPRNVLIETLRRLAEADGDKT
jgi:hypothetical protein